jgi:acyl-CoA synthetase (NDP forming)
VPERLAAQGIYSFPEPARAVRALGRLVRHRADLSRPAAGALPALPFDWTPFVPAEGAHTVVPEPECHRILAAAGLPVAPGRVVTSEVDAVRAARAVGLPVALKGVSPAVTHRAVAGLLAVDLRTAEEVAAACHRLAARAREMDVKLDGLYVQRMVAGDVELLVSAFRDPVFGAMVTCGAGGGLTELLDDVAMARAPIDVPVALDLLGGLRIARRVRWDAGPAAEFVARFSRLVVTAPWPRFVFEVNPIRCGRDGVVAVDGLLIVEEP